MSVMEIGDRRRQVRRWHSEKANLEALQFLALLVQKAIVLKIALCRGGNSGG